MFSKNIIFKNFQKKKNIKVKKKIKNILKKELIKSKLLLNSFNKDYKYGYKKKFLNKYKDFATINLIGMGGSILGTEAIYDFLKFKINSSIFTFGTSANISSKTLVRHSLNAAGKLERTISKPLT